jgi:hypothetical protein
MLFSRIVRSRGSCERCGAQATDCAHIIPRRYSATRCVEQNAWALCRRCHQITGERAYEFVKLVQATVSEDVYWKLSETAEAGIGTWNSTQFWENEVLRLEARCVELGIDMRVRIPK